MEHRKIVRCARPAVRLGNGRARRIAGWSRALLSSRSPVHDVGRNRTQLVGFIPLQTWAISSGSSSRQSYPTGQNVLADTAYDADWIRNMIREQGAVDVIPRKANRRQPAEFGAETDQERTKIERFLGRLKSSSAASHPATEKTSRNVLSMIKLCSVRPWRQALDRVYESVAWRGARKNSFDFRIAEMTLARMSVDQEGAPPSITVKTCVGRASR